MNKKLNQPILISIVTANSSKIFLTLDRLIASVGENPVIEIVIFDNNSDSVYKEKLAAYERYSYIKIHFDPENNGFGYGHNQNLLNSKRDFGVIFNPDILVDEQVVVSLVEVLKNHPECAMLAPKILNDDQTTQYLIRENLTIFDYVLRFLPFGFVKKAFRERLRKFECRDLPEDKESYVRMISGSFMVVDIQKFQQINGFDERYFMYFEDNDLCLTFEQQGEKLLYTPHYSVVHLYGKGAHRSFKLFRIFLKSMYKFFHKWGWQFF